MNIKNSLQISIILDNILKYLNNMVLYLFKFTVIFMVVSLILLLMSLNFTTLTTVLALYIKILLLIPSLTILSAGAVFSNNSFNKTKKYLKTTYNEQLILYRLFNKPNHSSKLNLELQKISKAVENKSSLYQELNETDFPYLNKLFRRLNCSQVTHNNNNIENILSNDLNKLNISNPMLLTFEQVDNELNNLISQNILNQNTKCVKTMED